MRKTIGMSNNEGCPSLNCPSETKEKTPFSKGADTLFSVMLLPVATISLGAALYFFYMNLMLFGLVIIAGLVFGFSCMGLQRMWILRKRGESA